jgi:AraC-like DNA-binding protein
VRPDVEFIRPTAGREWAFQTRSAATFDFSWHAHDLFELTIIADGTGRRFAGDGATPYGPWDVALFGPQLPHTYASTSGSPQRAYIAHFPASTADRWVAAREFRAVRELLERAKFGVAVLRADERLRASVQSLVDASGARQTLALASLLVDLAESQSAVTLATSAPHRSVTPISANALTAIVGYLEEQFREPIARDRVASAAAMSPTSVSRLMRRYLGTTLTDYVITLRVAAACRELAETDAPIAAIAHRSGFSNLTNFNRQFRRSRHMSPREYRRAFAVTALPGPRGRLQQVHTSP